MDQFSASLEVLKQQLLTQIPANVSLEERVKVSAELFKRIQSKFAELEATLTIDEDFRLDEYRARIMKVFETISSTSSSNEEALALLEAIYKQFPLDVLRRDPINPRPPPRGGILNQIADMGFFLKTIFFKEDPDNPRR